MAGQGRARRGRQAEAERNDLRVLEAAREVFATQGPDAPVAAVAERAGVGMGSLYRRYDSKAKLLQRLCILAMDQAVAAAEAAHEAEDPWTGLAEYVRACVGFRSGALAPLAGRIETTPEMWATSRRARELANTIVERAHRQGSLRHDATALDVARLIEQFARRGAAPTAADDDNVRERLVAIALDGLRAGHGQQLPGSPPTTEDYERPWGTSR